MKKKVGIIKRVLCIVLIFLLSINSFASVVSDNDGSAFITKSEFDALKSSFQAQIDSYNQSIDSKIDGAIASYLSGIRISNEWELKRLADFEFINKIPETRKQGKNYNLIMNRQSRKKALEKLGSDLIYVYVAARAGDQAPHPDPADYKNIVEYCAALAFTVQAYGDGCMILDTRYDTERNPAIKVTEIGETMLNGASIIVAIQPKPGIAVNKSWIKDWVMNDETLVNLCMASFNWASQDTAHWVPTDEPMDLYSGLVQKDQYVNNNWTWLDSNMRTDGSGVYSLISESVLNEEPDDTEERKYVKKALAAWKVFSQVEGAKAIMSTDFMNYVQFIGAKYIENNQLIAWINANKITIDGVEYIYLKDLYEAANYYYGYFNEPLSFDEVNKTETTVITKEWSENDYGAGYCIDYKSENSEIIPYLNSFSNKTAAQLYLTTQLHTYSEATNNMVDTNWDDTTYGEDKNYGFLPTYDVATSSDEQQSSLSTKDKNMYWKQNIYPFVAKPDNDNTAFMMVGKHFNNSDAGVYCFDNANTLKDDIESGDWVEISGNDTKGTRIGVWNDNGTIAQKLDYVITAGSLKIPTYKIKEEQRNIYDLYNQNASTAAGKQVKVGSGVLCATVADQRQNCKVGLKFNVYNETGNIVTDTVHWQLSDDMFDKCNVKSGATLLASGNAQSGTLVFSNQFNAMKDKNEIWLNCYADTEGNTVKIDTFTIN